MNYLQVVQVIVRTPEGASKVNEDGFGDQFLPVIEAIVLPT
jgi:hypothetical protein